MLRLIGKPYIARACWAAYDREMTKHHYRVYMSKAVGGLASMNQSWEDCVPAPYSKPVKQQSPEEIKARILNGLRGGGEDGP